jgi:predicted flap endonuclease-1-like 5' DNA nuclease
LVKAENYLSGGRADSERGCNMRLDYALYGLAVVLFVAAVGVFFALSGSNVQVICTVSTAAIGVVCACVGFVVKPKTRAVASAPASVPTVQEAPAQPAPTVEASQVAAPTPEPPAAPVPVAEPPKSEPTPPTEPVTVETPVAEPVKTEAPTVPEAEPEPPAPAPSPVVEAPAVPASAPEAPIAPAPVTPPETPAAPSELTKIHGINQKRVDQLNANGINRLQDLANASAEDLAAKLAVSPRIVKMWIGSAKKQVK